jgi:protoporphyrinogen/coproporphyrinogen III oxidase
VTSSVVIIGGGIAGLSAAWELTGGAQPTSTPSRVELIEASPTCGGAIQTTTFDEQVIDLGADGFLARRPEVTQLVNELGLQDRLEPISASEAWIYLDGALRAIPHGFVLGVPTSSQQLRELAGLSPKAYRQARRDERRPRRLHVGDDATIGEIVRAKLGDEIALRVVEPMIGGIQAGRIDELSAQSVFPALWQAARAGGSLQRAIGAQGPALPGPRAEVVAGPAFFTLTTGVGSLAHELVRQLTARGVVFRTSTVATAIRRTPSDRRPLQVDTDTTTTPADAVIVATPAHIAGQLIKGEVKELLSPITTASAAMVTLSFERSTLRLPETGTGILVPLHTPWHRGESMMITAVTFLDRKWPHLHRSDRVVLRAHVGRSDDLRHHELSDDELITRVLSELDTLMGPVGPPRASRVQRWPGGLPQYRVGHEQRVSRAREIAEAESLFLAGNAYDGVGIPASVGSGRAAARAALAHK